MDFEDIKESISDLTHEKPLLFAVIAIIVFLFFAGLIVLMIQTSPAKKTVKTKEPEPFTADSSVLIPDAPDIEKEYYPNRVTENQWSEDEIKRWFTFPEDETMAELERANDKIASDIIGAAP